MAIVLPRDPGNGPANNWSDVEDNLNQLVTEIDARDDNYQLLLAASSFLFLDESATTWILGGQDQTLDGTTDLRPIASGTSITNVNRAWRPPPMYYFDDADFTIASKTQKLRVRAQVNANATAWSAVTATFGLYPVTFAGGTDILTMTLGTVVTGSTVAIANPSASSTNQGNSGDFTIPSDGQYALGVVTSATLTNNAASLLTAQLQTRHV